MPDVSRDRGKVMTFYSIGVERKEFCRTWEMVI